MTDKNDYKSFLFIVLLITAFIVLPNVWKRYVDRDIKEHSTYAFGQIIKKTGSLKNGKAWHYEFIYNNKTFKSYRNTHKDYNVSIGDFFLVNFSSQDPEHNKILYSYKLKSYNPVIVRQVWDTIPLSIVESSRK